MKQLDADGIKGLWGARFYYHADNERHDELVCAAVLFLAQTTGQVVVEHGKGGTVIRLVDINETLA